MEKQDAKNQDGFFICGFLRIYLRGFAFVLAVKGSRMRVVLNVAFLKPG